MAKVGSIRRKTKRKTGLGSFFCGSLFGFLMCILALVGVGIFVYYNVSIKWVNKTFNANIDTGNKELEEKTLNDLVSVTINLASSLDKYSLNDLEKDFGVSVPNDLIGLDISDLKSVAFEGLAEAFSEKLGNISAYDLNETGFIDLTSLDFIFDKTGTYYYYDGAIYRDIAHQDKVVKVKFENGSITIGDSTKTVGVDGSVELMFKYIPLTQAMNDFSAVAGEQLTLGELETEFNVEFPACLASISRDTTINGLAEAIDAVKVADFLGYKYSSTELCYYNDVNNNDVYDKEATGTDEEKISKMMNTLSGFTIGGLATSMNSINVDDLFDTTTGIFSLGDLKNAKLDEIPSKLSEIISTTKIGELHTKGIITIENFDENKKFPNTETYLKDMTVQDVMNALFSL